MMGWLFKKKEKTPAKKADGPPVRRRGNAPIRASEIGTFLYCQRAWWYQRQGYASENTGELRTGSRLHRTHGRMVMNVWLLRLAGYLLALAALALFTIYFLGQWL